MDVRERPTPSERSISAVLTDIVRNIQEIVRGEIHLAESGVREQLRGARTSGILMLIGTLAGALSALFLLLAAFAALSRVMAGWAAAVCVAVPLAVVAIACCSIGASRLRRERPVGKAPARLKENVEWANQQTR